MRISLLDAVPACLPAQIDKTVMMEVLAEEPDFLPGGPHSFQSGGPGGRAGRGGQGGDGEDEEEGGAAVVDPWVAAAAVAGSAGKGERTA